MPRQSRIDAPGALHHVLIRGIERRKIFKDDADRENFLDRLGGILVETSTSRVGVEDVRDIVTFFPEG